MNINRIKNLNNNTYKHGKILYLMSRDIRVEDNHALSYTQELAHKYNTKYEVLFILHKTPKLLSRHYIFLSEGIKEVSNKLFNLNIEFDLKVGDKLELIKEYIKENNIGYLVTDFSPLIESMKFKKELSKFDIPVVIIDTHNIVPVWVASDKQEYAAYTIRKKINSKLDEYLKDIPQAIKRENRNIIDNRESIELILNKYINKTTDLTGYQNKYKGGTNQAKNILNIFISSKLKNYDKRNDPSLDYQSNLSPYLHFGNISSQFVVLEILKSNIQASSFLDEIIIRKELSDNFCYYNNKYKTIDAIPNWAKETLSNHIKDTREYLYTLSDLESSKTYDNLWNSANNELKYTGKMHGYMRMYWAKKILEWTSNPNQAIKYAIYLNDKYSLDGRDPNGYIGILWSIGGLHDRPWFDRKIFGMIRYMSSDSIQKKYNVKNYINKFINL